MTLIIRKIALQLPEIRAKHGLTQLAAAKLIGAALRTWQDWEGGRRNMPRAKFDLWKIRVKALS